MDSEEFVTRNDVVVFVVSWVEVLQQGREAGEEQRSQHGTEEKGRKKGEQRCSSRFVCVCLSNATSCCPQLPAGVAVTCSGCSHRRIEVIPDNLSITHAPQPATDAPPRTAITILTDLEPHTRMRRMVSNFNLLDCDDLTLVT